MGPFKHCIQMWGVCLSIVKNKDGSAYCVGCGRTTAEIKDAETKP
jgi:predicted Fe-S protein YdhL (DUF1289 family)